MFDQGYAYSLGTGAYDVYTREQPGGGGGMMLMGFINVVTGPLMVYTGTLRGVGAATRIAEAGSMAALTPARALSQGSSTVFGAGEMTSLGSGAVRQGRLILSYEADGPIVGIVQGRSDVLLIARNGEAVLYVRTAEGQFAAVERAALPPGGAADCLKACPASHSRASGLTFRKRKSTGAAPHAEKWQRGAWAEK